MLDSSPVHPQLASPRLHLPPFPPPSWVLSLPLILAASSTATVPFASLDPNIPLWDDQSDPSVVSPVRGQLGASILGPDNIPIDLQNPDLLAPPSTDAGSMLV